MDKTDNMEEFFKNNEEEEQKLEGEFIKKNLGKVDINKYNKDINSDILLGYYDINIKDLPSRGYFYPYDTTIKIRSARVEEIKHWSAINEEDLFDVENKINYIIKNCVHISSKEKRLIWKDILEEDKIYLIFAIRALTFKQGENDLKINIVCNECNYNNEVILGNDVWDYSTFYKDESIMKYYSEEERCFILRTKSYGDIKITPPSIGLMSLIINYIKERKEKKLQYDNGFVQLAPYYINDWRGLNNEKLLEYEAAFKDWDAKKYQLIYSFCNRIKVGINSSITIECKNCGAMAGAPISFREFGGIKKIFISDISDFSGELL